MKLDTRTIRVSVADHDQDEHFTCDQRVAQLVRGAVRTWGLVCRPERPAEPPSTTTPGGWRRVFTPDWTVQTPTLPKPPPTLVGSLTYALPSDATCVERANAVSTRCGLTFAQREVVLAVLEHQRDVGVSPTMAEMADDFGITVVSVKGRVDALVRKGAATRHPHRTRSISVIEAVDAR